MTHGPPTEQPDTADAAAARQERMLRIADSLTELDDAVQAISVLSTIAANSAAGARMPPETASAALGLAWAVRHLRTTLDALHEHVAVLDANLPLTGPDPAAAG